MRAITSSDLDHVRDFASSDLEDFAQLVDYNQDDGLITMDDNTYALPSPESVRSKLFRGCLRYQYLLSITVQGPL